MTRGHEDRLAHNEAVFRDINERIEAGHWPGADPEPLAFRCECARLGCNMLLELTIAEYERVRADSRYFVLIPGHEMPEIETVVHRAAGYVIVEKVGEAARVAEQTDEP